jgi:hypothetical protein
MSKIMNGYASSKSDPEKCRFDLVDCNGLEFIASCTFDGNTFLPPWEAPKSACTYENTNQITGIYKITSGQIGPTSCNIELSNGVNLKGELENSIEISAPVTGYVIWHRKRKSLAQR